MMKEIFVEIKDFGFLFHQDDSFAHNLISPAFLAFFKEDYPNEDEVEANQRALKKIYAESTEAFPILPENLKLFSFVGVYQQLGSKVIRCSDNQFRKCKSIRLNYKLEGNSQSKIFYVDSSLWRTKKVNALLGK